MALTVVPVPKSLGSGEAGAGWESVLGGNATVRGRDWYKILDAPVPTLDMTVSDDRSRRESNGSD